MHARVRITASQDLSASERTALRRLLDAAFDGDFSEDDWQHALGGWHALIDDAHEIVAHASVVPRRLWVDGRELRAGYVEAVAVSPDRQRLGLGRAVMTSLHGIIGARFDLGALSSGEWTFYEKLGWQRWLGPSFVRAADGQLLRTPEEDRGIMVLTGARPVALGGSIACEIRAGDSW